MNTKFLGLQIDNHISGS